LLCFVSLFFLFGFFFPLLLLLFIIAFLTFKIFLVVVHNKLEQDADVVMFIYRDEAYHPDTPDRGVAEIIVAKHRNGPQGTVNLAFIADWTRFADIAITST
jgi:hypothetical protein